MGVRVSPPAPSIVFQLNYSIDLQAYYLQQSTWVDNMVDKSCASYLYQKRGVYYFSKQVPCDVRQHYKRSRIVLCLKTKSFRHAKRMCDSILQRLHDYWLSLRLGAMPLPAQHLVNDSNGHGHLSSGPTLPIPTSIIPKMPHTPCMTTGGCILCVSGVVDCIVAWVVVNSYRWLLYS